MSCARAVLALGGTLALGACIPTGDGCPFGGCRGEAPPSYENRTVAPVVNPFEQGGRFRDYRMSAVFSGERMIFRDPVCRFEAVRDRADASPTPASWRTPPDAIHAIYHVVRSDGDCSFRIGTSLRISVAADGRQTAPDRITDRIQFGAAIEGARPHYLGRY